MHAAAKKHLVMRGAELCDERCERLNFDESSFEPEKLWTQRQHKIRRIEPTGKTQINKTIKKK